MSNVWKILIRCLLQKRILADDKEDICKIGKQYEFCLN